MLLYCFILWLQKKKKEKRKKEKRKKKKRKKKKEKRKKKKEKKIDSFFFLTFFECYNDAS